MKWTLIFIVMTELFLDTKLLLLGMNLLKFVYFEKATKFCEISTLLLTTVHTDKSKVEISQNFVAFSEYINFIYVCVNVLTIA